MVKAAELLGLKLWREIVEENEKEEEVVGFCDKIGHNKSQFWKKSNAERKEEIHINIV